MASEVMQLAILLTAKDAASRTIDGAARSMKDLGKDGEAALRQVKNLKSEMAKGLGMVATGGTGLHLFRQGINIAAEFQFSMTDLKATLAQTRKDGSVDLDMLGKDLLRAEAIALHLGNALPGTTEDFVQMMTVLKQNGLTTEQVLGGVAEAAGKLAVANNQIPRELAKDYAQIVNLYRIPEAEAGRMADTFSRLYTSTGIQTGELLEASKYFMGRSGGALGIEGIEDAEKVIRLFGLMRKQGMEGSAAGTALDNFFIQYLGEKDKMQEIASKHGIKLDFFDEAGKFRGIDNLFKELEPLRKLSEKDQAQALQGIFGQRGMSAAQSILQAGVDGWKQYNAEQDKTVGLAEKNAMKSKDYINQVEALTGSMKNVVVTGFEPWLDTMGRGAEIANEWVGGMQEFMKAHPTITATATGLLGIGSAGLILVGSVRAMVAGWRLWRLVSAITRGDSLIPHLQQTKKAADAAGTSLATAQTRARGLRGLMQNQAVNIGVNIAAVYGIDYLINRIASDIQKAYDAGQAKREHIERSAANFQEWKRIESDLRASGTPLSQADIDSKSSTAWFAASRMGLGNVMPSMLAKRGLNWSNFSEQVGSDFAQGPLMYPISWWTGATNPFARTPFAGTLGNYSRSSLAEGFKQTTPELGDSRIMAAFLRQLEERVPDKGEQADIKKALAEAFPQSFIEGMQQLAGVDIVPFTQSLMELSEQASVQKTNTGIFKDLGDEAGKVPPSLIRMANAANSASFSLQNVSNRMTAWQPPQSAGLFSMPGPSLNLPSRAIGGVVERDGMAMLHAGNVISPAKVTKGVPGDGGSVTIHYSPAITVNGGGPEVKKEFRALLNAHAREVEDLVARAMSNRRARA